MKRIIFAVTALVTITSGCAVGPHYLRPFTSVGERWFGEKKEETSSPFSAQAVPVTWWNTFNDPMLSSLVRRAAEANLDLKKAQARLLQAKASRTISIAALFPELGVSSGAQRSQSQLGTSSNRSVVNPATVPLGSSFTQTTYQAGLDVSWELDIFGGIRRSVEAAAAEVQAAEYNLYGTQISLIGEVGTHYFTLRGLQQRLLVAQNNKELQERNARIVRKRSAAGFANALDLANAEGSLATTMAQIPQLQASIEQEIFILSVLLGGKPSVLVAELSPVGKLPDSPATVGIGFPSEIVRRRPDIQSAESTLHAQTARVGVAVADLFPRLSLSATLGLQGRELSALSDWEKNLWSVAASVAQPIFNAGRRRAAVSQQEAAREESFYQYHQVVLTALQEVESTLTGYRHELLRREALQESVRQNKKAVSTAMALYTGGNTDFLNVLTAQRSLYSSEDALTTSRQNAAVLLVTLYKALGGGWGDEFVRDENKA